MPTENLSISQLLEKLDDRDIKSRSEALLALSKIANKLDQPDLKKINEELLKLFFDHMSTALDYALTSLAAFAEHLPRFNGPNTIHSVVKILVLMLVNKNCVIRDYAIMALKKLPQYFFVHDHAPRIRDALTQLLSHSYNLFEIDAKNIAQQLVTRFYDVTILKLFSFEFRDEMNANIYWYYHSAPKIEMSLFSNESAKRYVHILNNYIRLHYWEIIKNTDHQFREHVKKNFLEMLRNAAYCKKNSVSFPFTHTEKTIAYSAETKDISNFLEFLKQPKQNSLRHLLVLVFGKSTFSNATYPDTTAADLIVLIKTMFNKSGAHEREMKLIL